MKSFINKFKYFILGGIVVMAGTVYAVQVSVPSSNGSGFLLQSGSNGLYLPVSLTAGSNVTISTTTSNITISSTGGGTFPFTVNSWGNSTTSTLGFLNGFLSTASSTISAPLRLTSLTGPAILSIDSTGLVVATGTPQLTVGNILATSTTATSTFAGPVSISGWNISTSTAITVCKYPDFCQYQVNPNSTSTDVQINLALIKASETKTKVYLRGYGTSSPYIISNIIQLPSNTGLIGDGIDVSVIKADLGYNPSTNCNGGTGRRCMIIQKDNGTIYNNILTGFTLDQNVQNISGLSSNSTHRAIWIENANNLMIDSIKTINTINWAVFVGKSDKVWIQNSIALGGYSNTYDQNDGFHIRNSDNWFITNNYCDTLAGGGTSGDDCYVFVIDTNATKDMFNGVIANNIQGGSGSRGIIGDIDSPFHIRNVVIANNVVSSSTNAAIKIYVANNTTGRYYGLNISNNSLWNFGINGSDGGDGIRIDRDYGSARPVFEDLTITGNTLRRMDSTSWYGINILPLGSDLVVNDNNIDDIAGAGGIRIGDFAGAVTDCTVNGNKINVSGAANNAKGIRIYNSKRCTVNNNNIYGHTNGTTDGIYVESTSSLTTSYNDVSHNNIYTFDNGVREVNSGANPDFNQYIGNTFNTVTTPYTLVGGSSAYFGLFGGSFGIGTSSPLSKLEITNNGSAFRVSRGQNAQYLDFTQSSSGSVLTSNADYSNQKPLVYNLTLTGTPASISPLNTAYNWQVQGVSKMFLDGLGRLGVGTSTPAFLLNLASTTQPQLALQGSNTDDIWSMRSIGNYLYVGTSSPSTFATSSATALTINNNGYVGIGGNTSPATNLEVIGNIRARRPSTAGQYVEIQSNSSSGMFLTAVSDISSTKNLIINNSVTGGSANSNTIIAFQIDDIEKGRFDSSGNFGVGSTTPWKLLSVGSSNTGSFAISSSTAGCAQFSSFGELYSTGTNCGSAGGSPSIGPINTLQASDGAGAFMATGTPYLTVGALTATSTTATSTMAAAGMWMGPSYDSTYDNLLTLKPGRTYGNSSAAAVKEGVLNIDGTSSGRILLNIMQGSGAGTGSSPEMVNIRNQSTSATGILLKIQTASTQFSGNLGISVQGKQAPAIELNEDIWNGGTNNQGQGLFQISSHGHTTGSVTTPSFSIDSRNNSNSGYCSDFLMSSNFATTTYGRFTLFNCTNSSGTSFEGSGRFNLFGTSTVANLVNFTSLQGATEGDLFVVKQSGANGFGTSTPVYALTISSSTAPQLALSAGGGIAQWTFRNAGGNFYISTTTVVGTATTSTSALTITNGGEYSISTTTAGTLKITAGGLIWSDTSAGGGGYNLVQDEGTPLTARTTINCVGAGITCSDSGSVTTFTVTGSSFTGGINSIVTTDGTGNLQSTSTHPLYVGAFNATSTTLINRIGKFLAVNGSTGGSAAIDVKSNTSGAIQGLRIEADNVTNTQFSTFVTGDAQTRFSFLADGIMKWSTGASTPDVQMYRNQAGTLGVIGLNTMSSDAGFSIGTTSPWGRLSLVNSTTSRPILHFATTTGNYGDLMTIWATTTTLVSNTVNEKVPEVGVRVGIGLWNYKGYGGLLDQLTVQGRLNTSGMLQAWCDTAQFTALSADGIFTACPNGFLFNEDNTGTTAINIGNSYQGTRVSASTAAINNDGAGVFFAPNVTTGWLTLASSTPAMEVNLRIRNSTATTTGYYAGFTNLNINGGTMEVEPTVGCFFVATSTQNWRAVSKTSNVNATYFDTGIASTSSNAANGTAYQYRFIRVQGGNGKCEFFMQDSGSANLFSWTSTTNIPSDTLLNPGVHYGIVSQNTSSGFDFFRFRVWWKDVLPSL